MTLGVVVLLVLFAASSGSVVYFLTSAPRDADIGSAVAGRSATALRTSGSTGPSAEKRTRLGGADVSAPDVRHTQKQPPQ